MGRGGHTTHVLHHLPIVSEVTMHSPVTGTYVLQAVEDEFLVSTVYSIGNTTGNANKRYFPLSLKHLARAI